MTGNVEFLVIAKEHFFRGLVFHRGGEDLPAQLLQRYLGQPGHPLRGPHIPVGAGRGLEHNGVGQDSGGHHAGHLGAGQQPPLLEHRGNDGVGRAHRLIAEVDGMIGLHIGKAVVVNDGQNFRLFQSGHGLGGLVVVHQHNPLAPGAQQMIPGQHAGHTLVFVQNGVAGLSVLEHLLLHIVQPVVQMEALQLLGAADAADGGGLEDQTGGTVSIKGGKDDARSCGQVPQLFRQLRLTQHQAAYIHFQRPADHLRLMAAEDNGLFLVKQQILPAHGQGDGDLAGDGIGAFAGGVEHFALQHAQHIKQRHFLQIGRGNQIHIVACHIFTGKHTVQRAVLVGDRQGGDVFLSLQLLPCPAHRHGSGQHRRGIKIQIPHLGVHIVDLLWRLEAKAVENDLGLVGNPAQAGGFIFPVAQSVAQGSVGHSGHDGVGIGVSVSGYINGIHKMTSCKKS